MSVAKYCMVIAALVMGATPLWAGNHEKKSPQKRHDTYMGYAKNYRDKALKLEEKATKFEGEKAAGFKKMAELHRGMATQKEAMAKAFLSEDQEAGKAARARYKELSQQRKELGAKIWGHKKKEHKKKSAKKGEGAEYNKSLEAKDKEIAELKAQLKELMKRVEAVESK